MIYKLLTNCSSNTSTSLFPYDVENRLIVLIINIVHIIGVLFIQLGILLPSKLMKYYILYIVFLFITYSLLNNRCFMTVLSNYYGKRNYNSLCIKMNDAKTILYIYLIIGIFFYFYPNYSIYYFLKKTIFK